VGDDLRSERFALLRFESFADQLRRGLREEMTSRMDPCEKKPEHSPDGEEYPGGWLELSRKPMIRRNGDMPSWGRGANSLAQGTETVALLTQQAAIDGGIELDECFAQAAKSAEQRGFVVLRYRLGSRFSGKRRPTERVVRYRPGSRTFAPSLRRCRSGRAGVCASSVDRIELLRTQRLAFIAAQLSMFDKRSFPPRCGADLMTHAPLCVRRRTNLGDDEIGPSYLPSRYCPARVA